MTISFVGSVVSRLTGAALLVLVMTTSLHAQGDAPAVSPAIVAAVSRARSMVDAGEGAKARDLLDSLVAAVPRESLDAGEVLYWRALLSDQEALAERDWKRIVVDVPFSPRASDALLRLSEMDLLRGNFDIARQHVQRLLLDHPDAPQRPRALLVLARAYFNEHDAPRACGVLTVVRREAPLSAAEVRLQADELQQQCRNVQAIAMGSAPDSTRAANASSTAVAATLPGATPPKTSPVNASGSASSRTTPPVAPPAGTSATRAVTPPVVNSGAGLSAGSTSGAATGAPPTTSSPPNGGAATTNATASATTNAPPPTTSAKPPKEDSAPPTRASSTGHWVVQVAAYDTHAQAEALVKQLAKRKLDAHVEGTRKPFRVQIGHYKTRAEAAAELAALKKRGQSGFVAEVAKP